MKVDEQISSRVDRSYHASLGLCDLGPRKLFFVFYDMREKVPVIMLKLTDLSRVNLKSLKRWRTEDPYRRVLLNTGFFATVREMAGCRRQTFNLPQASCLTKVCRNWSQPQEYF